MNVHIVCFNDKLTDQGFLKCILVLFFGQTFDSLVIQTLKKGHFYFSVFNLLSNRKSKKKKKKK